MIADLLLLAQPGSCSCVSSGIELRKKFKKFPLANLITVSAASTVKEITHASTVPFGLPSPIASTLGQGGLWGASAFGAEDCLSTATHQIPIVNSVHFSGLSFTQVVLFRVLL